MKKFLTVREAAEHCDVSTSCIYHWISNKDYFKVKKIGGAFRIESKSLLKFMKGIAA